MTSPAPKSALAKVAAEASECTHCALYRDATQTVFGAGDGGAAVMLVGEQPGDHEDRQGAPFVGPAGRVLAEALAEVGLGLEHGYVTNAVKHFKFEARGKRRIHKKPDASEVAACHVWLERELAIVVPKVIVAFGVTAGAAVLGRAVRIGAERGTPIDGPGGATVILTAHPSSILHLRDKRERRVAFDALVADLTTAAELAGPA